ncbi:MAG: Na(+)-translocating NADH-quinone reductase subunit A [bacterium]
MKITRGLDIPIAGKAETASLAQIDHLSEQIKTVALLGRDYHGLRPTMKIQQGDTVKLGQVLFEDKKNPEIAFVAPAAGTVTAIHRGAKRVLQSVVITCDPQADPESDEYAVMFSRYSAADLPTLAPDLVRQQLQQSGAWTAFRTRPYSKIPACDATPYAIYVTAMDTNPLAADPLALIEYESQAFLEGLSVLSRLSERVFVCHETGKTLPKSELSVVSYHAFSGVHPAGLVGTHIHHLSPVSEQRVVWHLQAHDVVAIGKLFTTGRIYVQRLITLAGSMVRQPRIVWARMGASTNELIAEQLHEGDARVISGSILNGHRAVDPVSYLSRYSLQVSVLPEGQPRQFMHWVNPFLKQFSVLNVFFKPRKSDEKLAMSSSQNGSPRAMVPIGNYESIMPLDILPTQLLRALLIRDTEVAKALGCLELDEEDLALCTFVCHSKYEYGEALRACLEMIEKEG